MTSRRSFLGGSMAAVAGAGLPAVAATGAAEKRSTKPPNIIVYLSDQFRWDFLGANGRNPSTRTPNLDAMAASGVNFTHAVTNQPVCGPARSVLMTSRYATEAGVWHNGLAPKGELPTLAGELRKHGYTCNMLGKWHLAPDKEEDGGGTGYVKPQFRGGFLDLWEGANALEHATHPYEGTIYTGDGKEISFKDQYRVDFLTDRAERFLRSKQTKPFFLFISQLEPHQQNDVDAPVGPHGSVTRFANCFVPEDLRPYPGAWQSQLPDYYGCCEAIDTSVGRIRSILQEEKLADNTVLLFMSDHGCHFKTRNSEYKRSAHNSSMRIPLLCEGPGFEAGLEIATTVGIIDLAPTLLALAGAQPGAGMKGRNLLPLAQDRAVRSGWPDEQLIQISESMTGRAIRSKDWTYCVVDWSGSSSSPAAASYHEYQMYDQRADPHELVNLAGRKDFRTQATELRERLKKLIVASGEAEPELVPSKLYL